MNQRARAVLLFVIVLCFGVLIFGGAQISRHKPPIPERVVAPTGEVVLTGEDIRLGQRQYLSRGGQQTGSIWGHGAYLAPDWSADALHRVGLVAAGLARGLAPERAATFTQADLEALPAGERGRVEAEVRAELRRNRYDAATETLTLSPGQAAALPALVAYYGRLFAEGSDAMSIPRGFVADPADVARDDRVLLLDRVGGRDRPARRDVQLHRELPARPARRERAARRPRSSGPSSPSSSSSSGSPWRSSPTSG